MKLRFISDFQNQLPIIRSHILMRFGMRRRWSTSSTKCFFSILESEFNEEFYTKKMRLNPSDEILHVGFKIALRKWIGSVALKVIASKSILLDMHYMFDKVNDMVELLVVINKKELIFFLQDNAMITFDVVSTTHTIKDVPIVWKGPNWESFLNMLLNAKVTSKVMVCLCD